jgi:plastocyanin
MNKARIHLALGLLAALSGAARLFAATANVTIQSPMNFMDSSSHGSTTTINEGDTVTWTWADTHHSTTSGTCSGSGGYNGGDITCNPDGVWDSGIANSGAHFSHTFATAGAFRYYCQVHGAAMTGTVVVHAASGCGTVALAPASLGGAVKEHAYFQTLTASGGAAPYTFAVTTGTLPPGLLLAPGGALSGTPTANGEFNFTVTATDASQCGGSHAFSLGVSDDSPAGDLRFVHTVGSLPGALGSFFKTQVQLTNRGTSTIAGTLVFHPVGASATPGDPSMSYTLSSWQTVNFDDLLPAMGIASGLGSLDVVPTSGPAPVVVSRIFNDDGADGTQGFSEPLFRPEDALTAGDEGVFILPADLVNYRLNMAVRTLSNGVTATITVWDASGALLNTLHLSFPPNYFTQAKSTQFLGIDSVPANGSIGIAVTQGSAIFSAPTVDNRTQDTSTQFTRHGD